MNSFKKVGATWQTNLSPAWWALSISCTQRRVGCCLDWVLFPWKTHTYMALVIPFHRAGSKAFKEAPSFSSCQGQDWHSQRWAICSQNSPFLTFLPLFCLFSACRKHPKAFQGPRRECHFTAIEPILQISPFSWGIHYFKISDIYKIFYNYLPSRQAWQNKMESSERNSQSSIRRPSSVAQTQPKISLPSDHFASHITMNHWRFITNETPYEKQDKAQAKLILMNITSASNKNFRLQYALLWAHFR